VPAVAGAALLAAFIFWERASDHPMLPLEFFANRVFTGAVATVALVYFALMGAMFLVPQYLQLVLGNSPLGSGLGMIPLAAGLLLASLASSSVAARVGVRATVTAGMSAVAAGLAAASMVGATTPEWVLATGLGVVGVGLGLTLPQATNAIVGSVPRQKSGIASAVNDAVSELGGSFGVAVLGAVLTTRYRGSIDQAVSDAGSAVDTLPGGVLEAVRESLGSASLAAPRAGADAADVITQTAGAAFTTGMGMALTAAAVVVAVGAVMAWRVFPRQLPASGHG